MSLERELQFYNAHKVELLKHYEGQFILVSEDALLGAFTTEAEAYKAGVNKLGNKPFLIRRVTKEEEIVQIPALSLGLINADLQ